MIWGHGKAIVEALLLAAPAPLSAVRIGEILGVEEREARILLEELMKDYQAPDRGIALREAAGGFQLVTKPELGDYVEKLLAPRGRGLSHAALETLAIIAYRQPITRAEIEQVRGVNVERILDNLTERGLIREVGRRDGPGRPILYGTTQTFLTYFGLRDLSELPPVEPEEGGQSLLRRMEAEAGGEMESPGDEGNTTAS